MGAKGKSLVPMQMCVEQECWNAAGQWSAKRWGYQERKEDSGQAMLMVGAGEAGTSCAMEHFPSVPGMASHMATSH